MMTFDGYEMRVEDKFSKVSKIWASPRRGLELHASRLPLPVWRKISGNNPTLN